MKTIFRRSVTTALSVLLTAGTIGTVVVASNVVSASPGGASTAPPWEPDANSVGGLVFYNASGAVITGGQITDSPIAAYVAGTTVIRSGDTKASLSGFLPVDGTAPGHWSGEGISASTTYPNGSAPSAVQSLPAGTPVVTGQSGDLTIQNLETDFPNTDTTDAGYVGAYQLRLRTSASGKALTTTYDSADIVVTGSTWAVSYSLGTQVTTTTSISTVPTSSGPYTSSVTLKATVTPSDAVGSVNFLDGTTVIGSDALTNGVASLTTASLPGGSQPLQAQFVPTNTGAFTTSQSSVENFDVTPQATSIKIKVSPSGSGAYGSSVTVTATVTPSTSVGSVAFFDGSKQLTSQVPVSGQAVYSTKTLPGGSQTLKVVFTPASAVDFSASNASSTFKVTPIATKVALKSSSRSLRKGAKLTLTATVTPTGVAGSVWFYDGAKKLASVKVAKGRAVEVTSGLGTGSHVLKAVFEPSSSLDDKTATSATVKVTVAK